MDTDEELQNPGSFPKRGVFGFNEFSPPLMDAAVTGILPWDVRVCVCVLQMEMVANDSLMQSIPDCKSPL